MISTEPDILSLKISRNEWKHIDHNKYSTWVTDANVKAILKNVVDNLILFAKIKSIEHLPRDDHKKIFQLIITFLSGIRRFGIHFGALEHPAYRSSNITKIRVYTKFNKNPPNLLYSI